jgi:hypothetical protein
MGISKLNCTLKGKVPPKWSLDEEAPVFIEHALKDVGNILHHFIPLSHESLLKQHINRIVCSVVFIFFRHGGFLGHARAIVLKRDKLETQLSILGPRRGHALKNDQEKPALIPLSKLFLARNESGDIIKKCTEISWISNNIT